MRRNMSGNLGLYKYLWPGSVYIYIWETGIRPNGIRPNIHSWNKAENYHDWDKPENTKLE